MFKRRNLQFSLRSFLVVVTITAIWLGSRVNRARTQREAVQAIEEIYGTVHYDWHTEREQLEGIDRIPIRRRFQSPREPSGPPFLRRLIGDEYFQDVESVVFNWAPLEPIEGPRPFGSSKYVLGIDRSAVRSVIPQLRRLKTLKRVRVMHDPGISESLAAELKAALPHCEVIDD